MRASILLLSSVAAIVSAQTASNSTCCNVDPGSIDPNQRLAWCRAQRNTCPELCTNGQTANNTCDDTTLTYSCSCSSGSAPNISDYSQTLPSLECDAWKSQCVASHPNDLAGQNFCLSFVCGSKNASAVGAGAGTNPAGGSSSSPSSSASGSSTASSTSSAPSSSSSKSAATILAAGREYGLAAVVVGLTSLFAFAL
ncbi:hypothetical protein BT63DRAFT_425348 [Microthyrium microscopicum]|uniref:DUF7707 domain-containing protein n=1 Tax=Microthyrium microscopicum TaxID=703497 RepID=A0A6A6UF04_9PEZI|nr:hypothetical protein BT63DRAFT_425348 [Microthyrium microscopicum]